MAKKGLSPKQIRAGFGGKRRKSALRSNGSRKRRKPAARRHARRTAPRKRANPSRRVHSVRKRRRTVTNSRPRRRARKNPELVSFLLGNPAKRRKTVARSRRKTRRAASRSNAGTRRRRVSHRRGVSHRRRHSTRRNPGMGAIGNPKTWLMGGAGALAGFVGSAALPQMFLGTGNTGMAGYAATAAAAVGLGLLSHFLLPRQPGVTIGVVSGGFANLIRRVISDQTPFGSYLSNPGMGDYMVANWGPPRMSDGLFSAMAEPAGTPWNGMVTTSSGVSSQDLADMRTNRPC